MKFCEFEQCFAAEQEFVIMDWLCFVVTELSATFEKPNIHLYT